MIPSTVSASRISRTSFFLGVGGACAPSPCERLSPSLTTMGALYPWGWVGRRRGSVFADLFLRPPAEPRMTVSASRGSPVIKDDTQDSCGASHREYLPSWVS